MSFLCYAAALVGFASGVLGIDNGPPVEIPFNKGPTLKKTGKVGGCHMIVETPLLNKYLKPVEEQEWEWGKWAFRVHENGTFAKEFLHTAGKGRANVPYHLSINSLNAPVNRIEGSWNYHKYQSYGTLDKKYFLNDKLCAIDGSPFIGLRPGVVHVVSEKVASCRPATVRAGNDNEGRFTASYAVNATGLYTVTGATDLTTCVKAALKENSAVTAVEFIRSTKVCNGYTGKAEQGDQLKSMDRVSCIFPVRPGSPGSTSTVTPTTTIAPTTAPTTTIALTTAPTIPTTTPATTTTPTPTTITKTPTTAPVKTTATTKKCCRRVVCLPKPKPGVSKITTQPPSVTTQPSPPVTTQPPPPVTTQPPPPDTTQPPPPVTTESPSVTTKEDGQKPPAGIFG